MHRRQLDILGFRGRTVPNTYSCLEPRSDHLVLGFPGWAYTAAAPLLYYTRLLAQEHGADSLILDYGYHRLPELAELSEDEQDTWFQREVSAALAAVPDYAHYTLVGKSIGTQAVAFLLETEPSLARARAVLLTPTFREAGLRRRLETLSQTCMTVIGSLDPDCEPGFLELARSLGELVVVDGADHALDVAGSSRRSIAALTEVIDRMRGFMFPRMSPPA